MFEITGATTRVRLAWQQRQQGLTPAMLVTDSRTAWQRRLAGVPLADQALLTRYLAGQWVARERPLTLAAARTIMRAAKRHGLRLTARDEHDYELVRAHHLAATRGFKSLPAAFPEHPAEVVMVKFDGARLFRVGPLLTTEHAGTLYASPRQLAISDGAHTTSYAWADLWAWRVLPYGFGFRVASGEYVLWTSDAPGLAATLANFLAKKVKHAYNKRDDRDTNAYDS